MKTLKITTSFFLTLISTFVIGQSVNDFDNIGKTKGNIKSIKEKHFSVSENFGEFETNKMLYRIDYKIGANAQLESILFISKLEYEDKIYQCFYNANGLIERLNYSFIDQSPDKHVTYQYEEDRIKEVKFYEEHDLRLNEPSILPNIKEYVDGKLLKGYYRYSYNQQHDMISAEHNHYDYYRSLNLEYSSYTGTYPFFSYQKVMRSIKATMHNIEHYNASNRWSSYRQDENNIIEVKIGTSKDSYSPKAKNKDIIIEYNVILKSYKYDYDEQGNWTKCTISYLGSPVEIITRDISYF